jgi:hypothetical protein
MLFCTVYAQVLYLKHSAEDLARCEPCKMGILQQGSSSWKILRDEETVVYGGSSRRKLYGCVITMSDGRSDAPNGGACSNTGQDTDSEQRLLSWSQVSVPISSSSASTWFSLLGFTHAFLSWTLVF